MPCDLLENPEKAREIPYDSGGDYSDPDGRRRRDERGRGGLFRFCRVEQFGDCSEFVCDLAHCIHAIGQ